MATWTVPNSPTLALPTKQELRAMLSRPSVVITLALCVTAVILSFVGAITYLAATGKGTEALGALVIVPVIGFMVTTIGRLSKIEKATNGTTTRLLDHALPPAQDGP